MKNLRKWAIAALITASGSSALAQNFNISNGASHSAFRDTSNIGGANLEYRVNLNTSASDPAVYLNQISLTPDANWDSNITLDTPTTSFDYRNTDNNTNGTYTLGTAISGAHQWDFAGAFRSGAIAGSVADGVYNTTLNFLGGTSASSLDTLASFGLTLQVTQKLDIGVTLDAAPSTIGQGQATQVSMTVKNNMTGLDFVSTTWYVSGYFKDGDFSSSSLAFNDFVYEPGWFNQTITPGGNRTALHSLWSATANQEGGDYLGYNGVVGGLYNGDFYFVGNNPQGKITVIPAPSSALSLLIGAGLLAPVVLRRKRLSQQSN